MGKKCKHNNIIGINTFIKDEWLTIDLSYPVGTKRIPKLICVDCKKLLKKVILKKL